MEVKNLETVPKEFWVHGMKGVGEVLGFSESAARRERDCGKFSPTPIGKKGAATIYDRREVEAYALRKVDRRFTKSRSSPWTFSQIPEGSKFLDSVCFETYIKIDSRTAVNLEDGEEEGFLPGEAVQPVVT